MIFFSFCEKNCSPLSQNEKISRNRSTYFWKVITQHLLIVCLMSSLLRVFPVWFMLTFVSLSPVCAGSQLPAFPSEPEYDLMLFDQESGSRNYYQIGELVNITYRSFEDRPSVGRPIKIEGALEEVNEHSILVDGNWISISSITKISDPSNRKLPMTETEKVLFPYKIILFPLLAILSFLMVVFLSFGNDVNTENGGQNVGATISLISWLGFSILSIKEFVTAFRFKKSVGTNRKLMSFQRN